LHFCSLTISWKRKSQSGDFSYVAVYPFQGPASDNPLSYKWYNAEEVILGKKMKVCTYSQMAHVVGCLNTYVK
jgi:xylose isomerase